MIKSEKNQHKEQKIDADFNLEKGSGQLNYLDMDIEELTLALAELKQPKFRARQVFEWLHKGAVSFDEMTSLSKDLRTKLAASNKIGGAKILEKHTSKIDRTAKYLFVLEDQNIVEGVLMHHDYGNTLCISSQVGCRMGCKFCASTIGGLVRNLTAGEMLGQVLAVERENNAQVAANQERYIRNIVIMGSGEPLDNYDHVTKFLKLVNHPAGIHMSLRNISLSTCGIVDKIDRLAIDVPGITLSISLHAPNDQKRRQIMPIASQTSIQELVAAARRFIDKTGRRIVFEYALIAGVNDGEQDAIELAHVLRNMQCIVNLIPVNPIKEQELLPPVSGGANRFMALLKEHSLEATIRREMGKDINGACGQLRNSYLETNDTN